MSEAEAPQVTIDYSGVSASWAFIPMLYSGEDREQAMRIATLMFLTTQEGALPNNWRDQAGHVLAFLKGNIYPERVTPDNVVPFGRRPTATPLRSTLIGGNDPNAPSPA